MYNWLYVRMILLFFFGSMGRPNPPSAILVAWIGTLGVGAVGKGPPFHPPVVANGGNIGAGVVGGKAGSLCRRQEGAPIGSQDLQCRLSFFTVCQISPGGGEQTNMGLKFW